MFTRLVRISFAAARHFSAEAGKVRVNPGASNGMANKTASKAPGDTLGRRLLSLVYAKRSAAITIRKWKEEGHVVQKYELNRIVRELRKMKRYKHALEVCEWMRIQEDIRLLSGDYAVHLDLIAKVRGMNSAEKFFEDMPDEMIDHTTCSALLHTYTQHQVSDKAEALFVKMSECDFLKHPLPYNHMMTLYTSTERLEKIPKMIQELKKTTSPDVVSYNIWLSQCASQNDIETAETVILEMKKEKVDLDWVTYSTLTNLYVKNSLKKKAASTLGEMEKNIPKNVRVPYSSLISLHASLENKDGVYWIWKKMKSLFRKLKDSEYTCMIASLIKLDEVKEAEKIYTEWVSVSPTKDSRVSNLLLAAYINKNQMEKAEEFYTQTVKKGISPSYTTWELMTWGYLKQNQMEKAIDSFKKAIGSVKKWDPDEKLVQNIFGILEEHGNIEGAENLLVILRRAQHINTEVYNSLLRTYAKAGKKPLIIAERMKKDNVHMDEETHQLIKLTRKMCVTEIPSFENH